MSTHRCTEQHLELHSLTLCADQTDQEIIRALATLTWTGSSALGFVVGGQLGSLASDVRRGRISMPGRSSHHSYELVQEAVGLALDRGGMTTFESLWVRFGPGLRRSRPALILVAIVLSLLALFAVFHEDLIAVTADSGDDPGQAAARGAVLPLLEAIATTVIPAILALVAVAAVVAIVVAPFILLFSLLPRR